jgi:tripartite-type tricarboxylate transporter receptor subunit TctC
MSKQGLDVQTNTPEQFAAMIRREIDQNTKLIRAAGIKPE